MARRCSYPIDFDDMTKRSATELGGSPNVCAPALEYPLFPLSQGRSMAKLFWRFSGRARQAFFLPGRKSRVLPSFCFSQYSTPNRVRVGRPASLPLASAARVANRCGTAPRLLHLPLPPQPSTMRNAFVLRPGRLVLPAWSTSVSAASGCGTAPRLLHLPLSPRPSTMRNAFVLRSGRLAPSDWGTPVSAARGGRA